MFVVLVWCVGGAVERVRIPKKKKKQVEEDGGWKEEMSDDEVKVEMME
jgi:hypothetical protein